MSSSNQASLIETLRIRFEENIYRHPNMDWEQVREKLEQDSRKLQALSDMESSGGEPDIILLSDIPHYVDCSPESPLGRRSLCYDRKALDARKENKPKGSALDMAESLGVELLTDDDYRELQKYGNFDTKTSSWIMTPQSIRELGGALFCDRRYDSVFSYHNGADSYYAVRGFRAKLKI